MMLRPINTLDLLADQHSEIDGIGGEGVSIGHEKAGEYRGGRKKAFHGGVSLAWTVRCGRQVERRMMRADVPGHIYPVAAVVRQVCDRF